MILLLTRMHHHSTVADRRTWRGCCPKPPLPPATPRPARVTSTAASQGGEPGMPAMAAAPGVIPALPPRAGALAPGAGLFVPEPIGVVVI
jgi:hypothetical protein